MVVFVAMNTYCYIIYHYDVELILFVFCRSTNSGQLYICLISPQKKRSNSSSSPTKDANMSKYLLCCLSLREKGLESFREDLDTFTGTLKPYLIKQVHHMIAHVHCTYICKWNMSIHKWNCFPMVVLMPSYLLAPACSYCTMIALYLFY